MFKCPNTFMFHFIWWWIPFLCCYLVTDSWQVATRFLSASPPLYWFASHLMVHPGSKRWAYLIWAYSAAYILLGSLLFSNFFILLHDKLHCGTLTWQASLWNSNKKISGSNTILHHPIENYNKYDINKLKRNFKNNGNAPSKASTHP